MNMEPSSSKLVSLMILTTLNLFTSHADSYYPELTTYC